MVEKGASPDLRLVLGETLAVSAARLYPRPSTTARSAVGAFSQ